MQDKTAAAESLPKLLRVLGGEVITPPPVWLMRQAGRYLPEYQAVREKAGSFLNLCFTPDLATEVTLQPIRRFGLDAAILFSDILVIPLALGQQVEFVNGEGPVLGPPVTAEGIKALSTERVLDVLAPIMQTVRQTRQSLPAEVPLIGFAGGPWTVATYMIEGGSSRTFPRTLALIEEAPAVMDQLMGLLVPATVAYLCAQIEAGAQVLQIFESWAAIAPEAWRPRWLYEPLRRIMTQLRRRHPHIPVIGFPRGLQRPDWYPFLSASGVDALSLDPTADMEWAAQHLPCPVQGNLDPQRLVDGGEPLRQEVKRLKALMGQRPYIFNLGHGIVPQTPPHHVTELVAYLREA